jgi:hypothetical protein
MAVRVDKDNDRVEESAVNDGVVIVDVVHGDGILESPLIRFMCLRRRLRQLQKDTKA